MAGKSVRYAERQRRSWRKKRKMSTEHIDNNTRREVRRVKRCGRVGEQVPDDVTMCLQTSTSEGVVSRRVDDAGGLLSCRRASVRRPLSPPRCRPPPRSTRHARASTLRRRSTQSAATYSCEPTAPPPARLPPPPPPTSIRPAPWRRRTPGYSGSRRLPTAGGRGAPPRIQCRTIFVYCGLTELQAQQ